MADIGTAYVRIAPNMTGIQGKIASGFRGSGSEVANQFSSEFSAKSAVIIGAIAGVAQAAVTKAMNLVSNSIGSAVDRVDALKRFPTVMANLGYSAEGAGVQIQRIAKELIGLPTSLDQLTTLVQRIAPVSGSLERATDVALAFNNAVLAGGGPTYRQADAIEQFSQMLSKGVPDMMAWRTLQEAMPATLSQTAKALGITSGNTLELYERLQDGRLTFDDFTNAIVNLNSEGLPGFKNFADQAKDSTSGIRTGFINMQTAITRGVAKIIDSFGAGNVSQAISTIGTSFESVLTKIAVALPPVLDVLGKVFGFVIENKDIFAPLAVGIGAVVAAMKLWQIATTIATAVQTAFNIVMAANPIGLIILALVGLVAGLTYFFTKTETGKAIMQSFFQVVSAVWNGIKVGLQSVGDFFGAVFGRIQGIVGGVVGWIRANWQMLLMVLTGPIGIAVGLIIRNFDTIKGVFQGAFNFVTGLWGRIGGFFNGIFDNIRNAFNGIAGVGRNIVEGLWNGISGMGGWLKDKIIGFVKDKIPGPVRDALGIRSPSKVFAEIGHNIDRGLAKGIEGGTGMVSKSVDRLTSSALAGVVDPLISPQVAFGSSANLATGGGSQGDTTQTVTIGTVALGDSSAVKEFFRQLNQDTINLGMGLTPVQGAQ